MGSELDNLNRSELHADKGVNNQSNHYVEAEERPITGIKGDFKAYVENIEGVGTGLHT